MKFRRMGYDQALARHPGCVIELKYRPVDASHPYAGQMPTATAPAIYVWSDRTAAACSDDSRCLAIYWLVDDE